MSIIKNIIYSILALQEKFLLARLNKTIGIKNYSKRKKIYGDGCFLSIDSLEEDKRNKFENELNSILKQNDYEPEKLLDYIQKQGTCVYYIDNAKILNPIEENEGFIYPQKGPKALYLSLLTKKKLQLKTDEMFIISSVIINKFYFIYHLYNWYMYKHQVSGMNSDSITMLNKYLFGVKEEDINKLQLADIYKLKDAIKQDKSSIEFVLRLCRDLEGAKKAFEKISDEGANI